MKILEATDQQRAEIAEILLQQMSDILADQKTDLNDEAAITHALREVNFGDRAISHLWKNARDHAVKLREEIIIC
jgi:ABC-type phosphate/phosphonate transport system ATPase subunit